MKKSLIIKLSILTLFVVFYKKIIVIGAIVIGSIFFPEASQSLRHYCFGDGSQLNVSSDYIKNSPVVQKHLAHMKVGEKHKVGMHQWEDWRLSFVLNPFTIEKQKHKIIITQWIKFDSTGKVISWLFFIPIPDNIAHTFDCKPFMFHTEWEY